MNRATPDFEEYLASLRMYMKSQDELVDYNFDGSALSFINKVLAYDATNQGFMNAMMFNEMHSTAQLRGNIGSLVSFMSYTPGSTVGSKAIVDIVVKPADVLSAGPELTLSRFTKFSAAADGDVYPFVPVVDRTASLVGGEYKFSDVELIQGKRMNLAYDVNGTAITAMVIPHSYIDTSTLIVNVRESATNAAQTEYTRYDNAYDLGVDKNLFFLDLNRDDQYYIEFGDNVLSNGVADGNVVQMEYVVSKGSSANGLKSIIPTGSISGYTNIKVTVQNTTYGGSDAETADEIRHRAPISVWSGGSALNSRDYRNIIMDHMPTIADAISWSGDVNVPPRSGTEFVSAVKNDGTPLTDADKDEIVDMLKKHNVGSIVVEVADPDILTIHVQSTIRYNPTATTQGQSTIEARAQAAIRAFSSDNLEKFQSEFDFSELSRTINDSDVAVSGNVSDVTYMKEFAPVLFYTGSYTVNFNMDLAPKSILLKNFASEEGGGELNTYIKDDGVGGLDMWIEDAAGVASILKPIGNVNYNTGVISISGLRVTATTAGVVCVFAKSSDLNRNVDSSSGTFLKIGQISVDSSIKGT